MHSFFYYYGFLFFTSFLSFILAAVAVIKANRLKEEIRNLKKVLENKKILDRFSPAEIHETITPIKVEPTFTEQVTEFRQTSFREPETPELSKPQQPQP